ncbi:hypothetical protein ACKWTF_016509 [Chironomus riparius]
MTLDLYYIHYGDHGKWHKIPDYTFQVTQTGFVIAANNFMFQIFNQITQRLTSTGLMNHMVQKCFNFQKNESELRKWSILFLEDLEFGFFIWLGFCGVCCVIFIAELLTLKLLCLFKRLKIKNKILKLKIVITRQTVKRRTKRNVKANKIRLNKKLNKQLINLTK